MNLIDIVVLLLLVVGLASGARAGLVAPAFGLLGAAIGFALALVLATLFREHLALIEQPLRAFLTLGVLLALVVGGEAVGAGIGSWMSLGMRRGGLQPLDALGGMLVGAAHIGVLVWLLAGLLAAGVAPGLVPVARGSLALAAVSDRLPPPAAVAGRLLALLDTTSLPPLFAGLEPAPAPPVGLPPDGKARALAESAIASTGRVVSSGCAAGQQQVGSGFFVSPTDLVTNAHVVAGSTDTTVTMGGSVHRATVVAFDPDADLALLHVPGASAPFLELSATAPVRGTAAVALGYPGGGALTITPAAVTAAYDVSGPNIYGDRLADRSVIELRAEIRRGNSGGPLVVAPGVAGGVIFGASRVAADVGYAIGADGAVESLGSSIGSTATVDTGDCL